MRFDLHVHSIISPCSQIRLDEIVSGARAKGLDGVCITDHDTMEAGRHIREGIQGNGLCVVIGMEYTTSEGDFLLFGPFENLARDLSARELLSRVKKMGGVAIGAHPFRQNRSINEELIAQGYCEIVERVNGRNGAHENQRVAFWKNSYGVRQVAGSDAHSPDELASATTLFSQPVTCRDDLVQALKAGAFRLDRDRQPLTLQEAACFSMAGIPLLSA